MKVKFAEVASVLTVAAMSWLSMPNLCLAESLPLIDDFSDGTLAGWTSLGGQWVEVQGVTEQTADTTIFFNVPTHILQWSATDSTGLFSVQADMGKRGPDTGSNSVNGNQGIGFVFAMQDSGRFYSVHFSPGFTPTPGALQVRRNIVSSVSELIVADQDVGFVPMVGEAYTLRLDADFGHNTITVSLKDGVGDSDFDYVANFSLFGLAPGGIGLYSPGGRGFFDNVKILPEPSSALLLGLGGLIMAGRRRQRCDPKIGKLGSPRI